MSVKFWADVKLRTLSEDVGENNRSGQASLAAAPIEVHSGLKN